MTENDDNYEDDFEANFVAATKKWFPDMSNMHLMCEGDYYAEVYNSSQNIFGGEIRSPFRNEVYGDVDFKKLCEP